MYSLNQHDMGQISNPELGHAYHRNQQRWLDNDPPLLVWPITHCECWIKCFKEKITEHASVFVWKRYQARYSHCTIIELAKSLKWEYPNGFKAWACLRPDKTYCITPIRGLSLCNIHSICFPSTCLWRFLEPYQDSWLKWSQFAWREREREREGGGGGGNGNL